MSDGSYSYTTITAKPGEPTLINVSFYLDGSARIDAFTDSTRRPFLSVSHGAVSAVIAPCADNGVTEHDAATARRFADQAALYAAEVERRCNAQASGPAAA